MTSCWGFEHQSDAERFQEDLERSRKFGLALNTEKTRLIGFGRFAAQQRAERGLGRPETFDFLGFTHYCAKTKDGRFAVRRRRSRNGWRRSSKRSRPVDDPPPLAHREQGRWLGSVVRGHLAYYAVPGNIEQVNAFRDEVDPSTGEQALRRRSQKTRMNWQRMRRLCRSGGSHPSTHPSLAQRALRRQNPSQEPSALDPHAGICAGGGQQRPSLPRYQPSMYSKIAVRAAARVGHDCR